MNVGLRPLNVLALFAGGGGLELGIRLAVPRSRVVCFVEREAFACATLVRQMEEGRLAPCPVWTDVSTFDGRPWRGVVDLVAGGFPCQDVSNAGKRAGIDGERSGLWSEYARIVGEVRPRFVFVENVAALASRGLDRVAGDLAAMGFDAEWGCLGADDAGAPHGRERLFLLAHARRREGGAGHNADVQRRRAREAEQTRLGGRPVAYASRDVPERLRGAGNILCASGDRAGANRQRERDGHPALGRREGMEWPPARDDDAGWLSYLARHPGLEPAICRSTHGLAHRLDRLRLLGNGVVPDQAALAFRVLWERLHA